MIIFVPHSAEEDKPWEEWIQRWCPRCEKEAIVGLGRRTKQAHDDRHDWIRIRRGLCQACRTTFTFLPVWSLPYTHYSLFCRQQAYERYGREHSADRAVPPMRDPARQPDPSTILRWLRHGASGALRWLKPYLLAFRRAPTILAWDASRLWRTLIHESRSPHGPPPLG